MHPKLQQKSYGSPIRNLLYRQTRLFARVANPCDPFGDEIVFGKMYAYRKKRDPTRTCELYIPMREPQEIARAPRRRPRGMSRQAYQRLQGVFHSLPWCDCQSTACGWFTAGKLDPTDTNRLLISDHARSVIALPQRKEHRMQWMVDGVEVKRAREKGMQCSVVASLYPTPPLHQRF